MAGIKLFDSFDCEGSVNHQIDGTRWLSKASIVGLQKCRRHEGDIQYRHPDLQCSRWEEWKGCSWILKWHSRYLHVHFQIFSQSCTVYLDRVSWIIRNSESFGHIWTFSRCTCWRSEAFRSFDVPAAAVSPRWAFASDVAGRPWQSCKRPRFRLIFQILLLAYETCAVTVTAPWINDCICYPWNQQLPCSGCFVARVSHASMARASHRMYLPPEKRKE